MSPPIRHLDDLAKEVGDNNDFAFDYAGAYVPPKLPHAAVWPNANMHWLRFNGKVMDTKVVEHELTLAGRQALAERYSVAFLWPLALLHNCPICPGSARVRPDELEEILRQAQAKSQKKAHDV